MKNNKLYLATLHSLGFSHKKLHNIFGDKLFKENENFKNFYEKINFDILKNYFFKEDEINSILKRKKELNINFIEKKLEERNVEIIIYNENNFPIELKNISNPPYLIYVRGKIPSGPKIAVVGSRNITSYGKKVIENIIPDISRYFTIISGGAYGVDTNAHIKTLELGNKTISVIGTSISEDYPIGNKKMYDDIIKNSGAIISIFPIGIPGNSYNFPVRNEIVAGLSSGVIVIEAREKSGSLITSKLALDLGKDLFAVPGEIFKSNSMGCNNLIKNGEAKLVINSISILEEYNFSNTKETEIVGEIIKKDIKFSDELEEKIYNSLLLESFTADELVKKFNQNISTVSFKLSMLEINGVIKKTLGGKFEVK